MASVLPILETPRLTLRPFRTQDASLVQQYVGIREVADVTLNIPHPYLDGMAEGWIALHEPDFASGKSVCLALTLKNDDAIIGAVGISLNSEVASGELGYWLGLPYWNNGYMTEAAQALVNYAFKELNLTCINSHHLARNPASGRIMQKIGMKLQEVRKAAPWKGDLREDIVYYTLPKPNTTSQK